MYLYSPVKSIKNHSKFSQKLKQKDLKQAIKQALKKLKKIFRILNGEAEYDRYVLQFDLQKKHLCKKLTKREFFAKKEEEKWSKINRCC